MSKIHKDRIDRALIISEAIILNNKIYNKDNKSISHRYYQLAQNAAILPVSVPRTREEADSTSAPARDSSPEWGANIDRLFSQYFPNTGANPRRSPEELLLLPHALRQPSDYKSASKLCQPQLDMSVASMTLLETPPQVGKLIPPASSPAAAVVASPLLQDSQDMLAFSSFGRLPRPPYSADNALQASTVGTMATATCFALDPTVLLAIAPENDKYLQHINCGLVENLPSLQEPALDG